MFREPIVLRGQGRIRAGDRCARQTRRVLPLVLVGMTLVPGCDSEEVQGTAAPPKAVAISELRSGVPRNETLVAGVVEPYRQSDTSFDVSGLVVDVIDLGEAADGPQLDGAGELLRDERGLLVREGTVLARLDRTRFRQAVTAAELSLQSTDRQIEALEVEIADVYPARIESARAAAAGAAADAGSAREAVAAAEAELDLARTTVERDRVLIESGAVAQSVLDESESAFRTATASLAQARAALDAALQSESSAQASLLESRGNLRVREADLGSLRSTRAELQNELERARTDLESAILRAPFQGRVTSRYIERGSYANAGTAIVQLTMEAAIKVVITVSSAQERRISLGMQMPIYTQLAAAGEQRRAFAGTVFEKASVADTGTRTFRIGLILHNPLVTDGPTERAASVSEFFPVLATPGQAEQSLFVNVAAAFERQGESFVLVLPDSVGGDLLGPTLRIPRVVPIVFTDQWQQLDTWSLRSIEPTDELAAGDTLVLNPTVEHESGVLVGSAQYAFRPGDVVRVGLDAALPASGFWVPSTALVPRTGELVLFTVEQGVASEIVVDVLESSGAYRRVQSSELREGDLIVTRGMQYLADGDAVTSESSEIEGVR